jgi:hypothetical protein
MTDSSLSTQNILPLIHTIRGLRVILASDLARLYSVPTKRLNEAVKRNKGRFPTDFMFQLTAAEWDKLKILRSQIAILRHGEHQKYLPYAFTEHGAIMAANVLNSPQAVAMSVYIVRAFIQQREVMATNETILKRLAKSTKRFFSTTRPFAIFTRNYFLFSSRRRKIRSPRSGSVSPRPSMAAIKI